MPGAGPLVGDPQGHPDRDRPAGRQRLRRRPGAQPRYLKAEQMAQASDLLAAETAERHRRVVVICDETHLLQPDQLEELRLLTNAEMDSASPFAGILARQPTLNRQLRMGMFAALD
jgi:type II secretory pathway predicted ATPase ExeA